MPIGLEEKKAIVAEVNKTASQALSAVMADYHGVSVDNMTTLRKQAREQNVQIRVIRNSLAKQAFTGTEFECMNEVLLGPNVLAFSLADPGAGARVFKEFAKENTTFQIKALSLGGMLLSVAQIDMLAKLPTRDEALAMLMSVILAPITKLARALNEVPSKIARAIAAIHDQKQQAS